MITRPMLAAMCTDRNSIHYPVLATPKLDGIRCLVLNGSALSRTFKPIRNFDLRARLEHLPDGLDGELIARDKYFWDTSSCVMSQTSNSTCIDYYVFDYVRGLDTATPYADRMSNLRDLALPEFVHKVLPVEIRNPEEMNTFERKCIDARFEGVIFRSPDSPYKCGRSTEKEGFLVKIKNFTDSDAVVIGFSEKMHNENPADLNELGLSKRSSKACGLWSTNTLGSLLVRDTKTSAVFSIGSGFDDRQRQEIWINQYLYLGKLIKYKHQSSGAKDLPRFPVFLGFRDDVEGQDA